MYTQSLPETVNYHFTSTCNMKCRFCFAGFRDCSQDSLHQHIAIIRAIAEAVSESSRLCRINFVGGEPTAYPYLPELLWEAMAAGLKASVATNGFMLVKHGVPQSFRALEIIGISVDSVNRHANLSAGRTVAGKTISATQWKELFAQLQEMGIALKINTTVTKYNAHQNLSAFIKTANPVRWKVFQGMVVDGQNARNQNEWVIDSPAFEYFVQRHRACGCDPVVESELIMRGSYAMISPDGRFFDSTEGCHTYSDPILKVGVDAAWRQISFDAAKFKGRTASYSQEVLHV
jgi:radical S-adenosyl methionine domain-containing protein 2